MSSIPNTKMKHAHVHEGENLHQEHGATGAEPKAKKAKGDGQESLTERAKELAEEAVDAVKARPKTAAAIGAAVLAGAAALVGGPAIAKAVKGEEPKKKPAAKKKAPAKKDS